TFDTTATRSFGAASAMAMAARSPAPPPPTNTTSNDGVTSCAPSGPLLRGQAFIFQHGAVVVNDFAGDAAVVVLMLAADAPALVVDFLGEQRFFVAIFVVVGVDNLAARRRLHREVVASDGHHSPSLQLPRSREQVVWSSGCPDPPESPMIRKSVF